MGAIARSLELLTVESEQLDSWPDSQRMSDVYDMHDGTVPTRSYSSMLYRFA